MIICDLDGTLCNVGHRRHFIEKKDWKSFYENIPYDQPNQWCLNILKRFQKEEILFVTGRPEEYRQHTTDWLKRIGYDGIPVFMRPSGDYRKDSEIKTEIYNEQIKPKYQISFCIDDRTQVVRAWRALGLICLQCDDGDF